MTTAKLGDKVKIHFIGTLDNGKEYYSTRGDEPLRFVLGKSQVIKSLDDAVTCMKVGDQKKIYVKASNAYGARKKSRYISFDRKCPKPSISKLA